jgi:hypothetical protein
MSKSPSPVSSRNRFPIDEQISITGHLESKCSHGDCPGNLSSGRHTGDGKSDGQTFLGRTWMFFLGGAGGQEKVSGHGKQGRSLADARFQIDPFCYILYVAACLQVIVDGEWSAAPRSTTDSTDQWV